MRWRVWLGVAVAALGAAALANHAEEAPPDGLRVPGRRGLLAWGVSFGEDP